MRALYHHRTQGRGVEAVHIMGIVSGLRENGFEVEIVGPPGVDVNPEIVVSSEKGRTGTVWGLIARYAPQAMFELLELGYNVAAIPRLWKVCRSWKPDLIYERYAGFNAAGVVVSRLTGIPIAVEINDLAGEDRTRQGKKTAMPGLAAAFERYICRKATAVFPVSGYLRDQIVGLGASPDRVRAIPNAVDPTKFAPDTVHGDEVRRRHGLQDSLVIGFIGSFTKWHGVDLLVQAMAQVAAEFPDSRLLLVGDGARRALVEELVAELGLTDRVVFAGKVPHADVPAYVAAMDVAVVPGANPFVSPVKAFEYMAMGKAPIAPRYESLQEAIEEGHTGLLFEPESAAGLVEQLRTMLGDSQLRARLGRAAREQVRTQHLWKHNARRVLELLPVDLTRCPAEAPPVPASAYVPSARE